MDTELKPGRGPLILILAILGFFCCLTAPVAWWMGASDLKEMKAGQMNRDTEQLTLIGMILGATVSVLGVLGIAFYVVVAVFLGATGVAVPT